MAYFDGYKGIRNYQADAMRDLQEQETATREKNLNRFEGMMSAIGQAAQDAGKARGARQESAKDRKLRRDLQSQELDWKTTDNATDRTWRTGEREGEQGWKSSENRADEAFRRGLQDDSQAHDHSIKAADMGNLRHIMQGMYESGQGGSAASLEADIARLEAELARRDNAQRAQQAALAGAPGGPASAFVPDVLKDQNAGMVPTPFGAAKTTANPNVLIGPSGQLIARTPGGGFQIIQGGR